MSARFSVHTLCEFAEALRDAGWTCIPPAGADSPEMIEALAGPGETPGAFCRRMGIHGQTLCRAWDSTTAPKIKLEMGPTGARVRRLWPTPAFEAWVMRNLRSRTRFSPLHPASSAS